MGKCDNASQLLHQLQRYRDVDRGTGCWVWTGCWDDNGYGMVRYATGIYRVHRLAAWASRKLKSLRSDHWVRHTCETPACFNPKHLKAVRIKRREAADG